MTYTAFKASIASLMAFFNTPPATGRFLSEISL